MRWYGKIGLSNTEETTPGVWEEQIIERSYYGDMTKNTRRWQTESKSLNDNLTLSNSFSIVADSYLLNNLHAIRYIIYNNIKWKVTSIDIQTPRLILEVGEVNNDDEGPQA